VVEAVRLVREEKGEILMKGFVSTSSLLRGVIDKKRGLRTGRTLSHVAVVEARNYPKLLLITDGGMNIKPDLNTKIDLIKNGIDLAQRLRIENPKVAVLGAIEIVNPEMPETLDAAHLSKMAERGQIRGAIVDGPLALDLAVSPEAIRHKKVKSSVAGEADILLVPDIACGNIFVKALIYLGQAKVAGVIMGASSPIVLLSRADTKETKLHSLALGVLCS